MNYIKLKNKVYKTLSKKGSPCKVIRKGTEQIYDDVTNTYLTDDIVINGFAIQSNQAFVNIDGANKVRSAVSLSISNSGGFMCVLNDSPAVGDIFSFGGTEYTITNVNPVNPSGTAVLYYDIQAS